MPKVFLSQDTSSRAAGSRAVEDALRRWQQRAGFELVLTGSRGAFFLEPLVEVATPARRVAYARVQAKDVPHLLEG